MLISKMNFDSFDWFARKNQLARAASIRGRVKRSAALLAMAALVIGLSAIATRAQNCASLAPTNDQTGRMDWTNINSCLNSSTHSARLTIGSFYIDRPIIFPRFITGTVLQGAGNSDSGTVITPVYACGRPCPDPNPKNCFVLNNQYQPVVLALNAANSKVSNFKLDLKNITRTCGVLGGFGVTVQASNKVEVSSLRISGSSYGDPTFNTGGATTGGINVINSRGCLITGNVIANVDFMFEIGGTSASHSGIRIDNSASTTVQNNTIRRVAFGIEVSNQSASAGYSGDSSGTTVTGNTVVGAGNINCPNCSQGRAIKLQACGDSTILPMRNLTVRNNTASEFGGSNGAIGGSGLDLICGVQYSTFESNTFTGAPTANYGLQIRSSLDGISSAPTVSHHNTINSNTFYSGSGQVGCTSNCVDVNFTPDGPDQIGVRRRFAGSNTFRGTPRDGGTYHDCGDYGHAFYNYPAGQTFINRGQSLTLAAAGVRKSGAVIFRFKRASDGFQVATYTSPAANGSCVLNQQLFVISASQFAPGLYNIFADYGDGNSNASIVDDPIGTIDVR